MLKREEFYLELSRLALVADPESRAMSLTRLLLDLKTPPRPPPDRADAMNEATLRNQAEGIKALHEAMDAAGCPDRQAPLEERVRALWEQRDTHKDKAERLEREMAALRATSPTAKSAGWLEPWEAAELRAEVTRLTAEAVGDGADLQTLRAEVERLKSRPGAALSEGGRVALLRKIVRVTGTGSPLEQAEAALNAVLAELGQGAQPPVGAWLSLEDALSVLGGVLNDLTRAGDKPSADGYWFHGQATVRLESIAKGAAQPRTLTLEEIQALSFGVDVSRATAVSVLAGAQRRGWLTVKVEE